MKKILTVLLLLGGVLTLSAQEREVTGRVVDPQKEPIEAVVIMMIAPDSTAVATAVSLSDGSFSMPLNSTPFTLIFEHLSMESLQKEFTSPEVGEVELTPKDLALDEVTVKAYRPIVKAEEGKLSYDMEQIAAGTTATNVYEAITKLPGVDEKDGALTLAGANSLTVIINGKPSSMTTEQLEMVLSSMPIERIKSAEVMYSAPPQYGVRGAAINLVIDRSQYYSYSGELRAGYSHKEHGSWNSGGSFAVSTPKWSADATYNYSDRYSPQMMDILSIHTVGTETTTIEQSSMTESDTKSHNIRAAFDYTPSDNRSLSVVYNASISPADKTTIETDGTYVNALSDIHSDNALHNIAVRYRAPSGFDIGADYSSYKSNNNTYLENIYNDGSESSFDYHSGQDISRLNLHADMKHSLTQVWSMSYGVKSSIAEDIEFQFYDNVDGSVETTDTDSSSLEWSTELYAGVSRNLSRGSFSASLSGEYYNFDGDDRFTLYPQANFMWMFNQDNILQANLSSNKTYPSYWALQDAITYVDGYTELHGNPLLKPMRTYSMQAVYIYKQRYIVALFANQINDYYVQNSYQDPDRLALIYKNINFDCYRQYGASVILPFSVGRTLSSKATLVGVRMRQSCDDFFGSSFDRSTWFGMVSLDNTIKFSENVALEVNGYCHSPSIQGTFDIESAWALDAGIKVTLAEKKLNLTAKCSDIFNSRMPHINVNYEGQNLDMYTGAYSRVFSLNLSYRFGGYTQKEHTEVDSSRFGR